MPTNPRRPFHSERSIFERMNDRCASPRNQDFKHYGGRGIRVCSEWRHSFAAFFAHVGPRPSLRHSIDRIDNDGNYEPGNVRWATTAQQSRNRRNNRVITAFGRSQCLCDWAAETGVNFATIITRIDRFGWTAERALSVPSRGRGTFKLTPDQIAQVGARGLAHEDTAALAREFRVSRTCVQRTIKKARLKQEFAQ